MKIMKNFRSSVKQVGDIAILIFTDEDGNDWYEAQKEFSDKTLKIMFDSDGVIVSSSWDVSMLAPDNLSVSEVKKNSVPKSFFDKGTRWVFDGEKIIEFTYTQEQLQQQAEEQRDRLLSEAKDKIVVSQTKLALGRILTDKQLNDLNAWLDYIDLLESCDTTQLPVSWPEVPGNIPA